MGRLTEVEQVMLREVERAGEVVSLFGLATDLCINYEHARHRLRLLQAAGLVSVERQEDRRGRPLRILPALEAANE